MRVIIINGLGGRTHAIHSMHGCKYTHKFITEYLAIMLNLVELSHFFKTTVTTLACILHG